MSLFEPIPKPDDQMPLVHEITQLADLFAEFNSVNAFLCSSLTRVMSSHEPIREEIIQGAKQCSEAVQTRGQELKVAIEHIRKRSLAASESTLHHKN
jgi:hypothetical protein